MYVTLTLMQHTSRYEITVSVLLAIALLGLAGGGYYTYTLTTTIEDQQQALATTTQKLATTSDALARTREANTNLRETLEAKSEELNGLKEQVEEITGSISTIERRQKLDEELLKKYSKVYFLDENYWPSDLTKIDDEWIAEANEEESEHFHEKAWPFLEEMLEDADDDDVELRIISAFRSFGEQGSLKSHYNVVYGESTANQFSASQGYSEHQLGTTLDFTTPELGARYEQFDTTEAYEWLQDNAHRYGFVLSYPENNQYYQFEPWHWRFVGEDLAEDLDDRDMNFYDMKQREIDEYLVDIFEE